MYIFLPYVSFVMTLLIMTLVVGLYYEYKEYRLKNAQSQLLPPFIKYIIFSKGKKCISEKIKFWWQDPYLYVGIILFIVIGAFAYLASLLMMIGIGYFFILFN